MQKVKLIAEIGNNHFGRMAKAKELIRAAKDSGADIVKGQAFFAKDLNGKGSMPEEFYNECQLKSWEYLELIDYAVNDVKIELFFSIFNEYLRKIITPHQHYSKISAGQFTDYTYDTLVNKIDSENVFCSVPIRHMPPKDSKRINYLHVSGYLPENPFLEIIKLMSAHLGRPVGYSDHTVGIENCILAVKDFGANVIEKHFMINKINFEGKTFRDTIHAATPDQFKLLAQAIK